MPDEEKVCKDKKLFSNRNTFNSRQQMEDFIRKESKASNYYGFEIEKKIEYKVTMYFADKEER